MSRLLAILHRLFGAEDPDHGDANHAGANTLAYYARQELRQGWDREAARCGRWVGSYVTEAARTLRWRER